MKRTIRLTESRLRGMIQEAVNEALNEIGDTQRGQNLLGQTAARAMDRKDVNTVLNALDRRNVKNDMNFFRGSNDRRDMLDYPDRSSEDGRRAYLKMQNNYDMARFEDELNYQLKQFGDVEIISFLEDKIKIKAHKSFKEKALRQFMEEEGWYVYQAGSAAGSGGDYFIMIFTRN